MSDLSLLWKLRKTLMQTKVILSLWQEFDASLLLIGWKEMMWILCFARTGMNSVYDAVVNPRVWGEGGGWLTKYEGARTDLKWIGLPCQIPEPSTSRQNSFHNYNQMPKAITLIINTWNPARQELMAKCLYLSGDERLPIPTRQSLLPHISHCQTLYLIAGSETGIHISENRRIHSGFKTGANRSDFWAFWCNVFPSINLTSQHPSTFEVLKCSPHF